MASSSPARLEVEQTLEVGLGVEESFSIAAGDYSDAEREYMLKKGLIYENSQNETLDITTDVESLNSSSMSRSHFDSLLMFEENERLYSAYMLNKSTTSENNGISPMKVCDLSNSNQIEESPEMQLSKLNLNESSVSPGYSHSINEEEEDKENEFKGPIIGVPRILFQDEVEKARDPLEEIKGIGDHSSVTDFNETGKSLNLSDNEMFIVPCTQALEFEEKSESDKLEEEEVELVPCTQDRNSSLEENSPTSKDSNNVEVVPCTQGLNDSINLNQTYTSETFEESMQDAEELVPCTQAPETSLISSDGEVSRLDASDNVVCSQASQGSNVDGSSKDELNDTIAWMEHALKEADKWEAREKLAATLANQEDFELPSPIKLVGKRNSRINESSMSDVPSSQNSTAATASNDAVLFKTPLKHNRVQLLKNKKVASPSPPRSFANAMLQQRGGGGRKMQVPPPAPPEKKPLVVRKPASTRTSSSSSPLNSSTPKRATPAATITPIIRKPHTPGRGGIMKTPIASKVDSGLRAPLTLGLSPVAKYIYDKPVPSNFARVQCVQNPKAAATASVSNTSLSRIPLPPPRTSHVPISRTTPASASKQLRHSVLRTSTTFNMASTPPQIVKNEKIVVDKKRFQPMHYTGASKVKALNGKVESPHTDDYVAHRHTGLRDESGNASFIQNTVIQKRNIPIQSRLQTPKSYTNK